MHRREHNQICTQSFLEKFYERDATVSITMD